MPFPIEKAAVWFAAASSVLTLPVATLALIQSFDSLKDKNQPIRDIIEDEAAYSLQYSRGEIEIPSLLSLYDDSASINSIYKSVDAGKQMVPTTTWTMHTEHYTISCRYTEMRSRIQWLVLQHTAIDIVFDDTNHAHAKTFTIGSFEDKTNKKITTISAIGQDEWQFIRDKSGHWKISAFNLLHNSTRKENWMRLVNSAVP